ncbi:MAG: MBL fold metallo-hydrolase [Burkholderiales bacterium]|nr:MAG: MBL fold metallo-hydrolase [Burkholderiales bacterium]
MSGQSASPLPLSVADAAALGSAHPARPSASLVVVRPAAVGLEVLLLRRAEKGDRNSGAWVFPGGLVDPADHVPEIPVAGLDDAQASNRLGVAGGGLAYWVAAVRECFEEAALLFAVDAAGVDIAWRAEDEARVNAWRDRLREGTSGMAALCRQAGWRLALDRLVYLSHWITPLGLPKRFDTRFFIAEAPRNQSARHDAAEIVEHRWLRPADALSSGLRLLTPTAKTLETLARFDTADGAVEWARAQRDVPAIRSRLGNGRDGLRPVLPDEPAWAEIGRLDPFGRGDARYEIRPGVAVRLSARVIRVTAGNPGVMTGPGTNSYLVGGGPANDWAVIDPGPHDAAHVDHLLAAAPGLVRWILVTHTHADHSPAVAMLKARTGAMVLGRLADHPEWQDAGFAPDRQLAGGESIGIDAGTTLRVIHTPGHASNHLCYLLEEEKTLFTGDHVMQRSTVVINPPDGDMAAYLTSLGRLMEEELEWLAPGHGFLMAQPREALAAIVRHRMQRETKVIDALRDLGPAAPIEALLTQVYDDVPGHLHAMATRSLKAHLIKLRDEGVATDRAGRWSLA